MVRKRLEELEGDDFWNCVICNKNIEHKRFFTDGTVTECLEHMKV
jgi:hypothetical protein